MNRAVLCLVPLLAVVGALPAQSERWHHPPSPYRASLTVTSQPAPASAGYFLEVPICGLGDAEGSEVFVFDAGGNPLPAQNLGRTRNNAALVLCGGTLRNGSAVHAYFGSGLRALPPRQPFTPGLLVDVRTADPQAAWGDWDAAQRQVQKSVRLGILPVAQLSLASNPIDDTDAFLMDFTGALVVPQDDTWELLLVNDDAGYLLVNDLQRPVIAHPAKRGADTGPNAERQACHLKAGLNPFRCLVIDGGGDQLAVLARWLEARRRQVLPPEAFAVSGRSRLEAGRARDPNRSCPVFTTKLVSYLGVENLQFTVFELRTGDNREVEWRVGNGLRGKSAVFRQLALGTGTLSVTASAADQTAAHGLIQFGTIPPAASWRDPEAARHYTELMLAQSLDNLSPAYLKAYLAFFRLYERNPATATVCAYLLADPRRYPPEERRRLTLDLARGAATANPEQARRAYRELLAAEPAAAQRDLAVEFFEFELYRAGDFAAAEAAAGLVRQRWPADAGEYERCLAELALLRDPPERAAAAIATCRARQLGVAPRLATVRANCLVENLRLQLRAGNYAMAEDLFHQWLRLAPDAFTTGQFALFRGEYLQRLGWTPGALAVVDRTLALNPLAAFLPDLEFLKAGILRDQRETAAAQTLLRKIVADYPNHPVAEQARRLLK